MTAKTAKGWRIKIVLVSWHNTECRNHWQIKNQCEYQLLPSSIGWRA